MRNVYRYMRVSTDQQAEKGYSLEAQDTVLADYAAVISSRSSSRS